MRKSKILALPALLTIALTGCASTEPAFAIPLDCQHQKMPSPGETLGRPSNSESGRTMSADCLKRIDNSRTDKPER